MEIKSKIVSSCKLGKLQEALKFMDLKSILQLCINSKAEKQVRMIHNHLLINGYQSDLHLNTKLIIFYTKIGDIQTARSVFDKMSQTSVVSWTALISGYCQNGYPRESIELFSEMRRSGVKANMYTYGSVLKACTDMQCLETGVQVQGCIVKSRFMGSLFVQSALVDLHSKCGRIDDGRLLFEQMVERDVVCWNAVIGGYAVHGLADDSFFMFRLMLREGLLPDQFSIGSVLRACSCGRSLKMVLLIHGFVIHLGFQSHDVVNGALIDAYAKSGNLRSARLIYDFMQEIDLISCSALITGYAHEGRNCEDALDVYAELCQKNMGLDAVVLCSMLNICATIASLSLGTQIHALLLKSHSGRDVAMGNALIDMYAKSGEIEDAHRTFDEMLYKNVVSWTSLITGYGKHGYGEKAISLFEKMEDSGLNPNDVTFLSVLFACSHNGMTNKGWEIFSSMISAYNIAPRPEHYTCIVDLFARGDQLEQAYNLLCRMNFKPNASLWGAILGASRTYGVLSVGEAAARHLFHMDPDNSVNYIALANIYSAAGLWEEAWKIRKLIQNRHLKKDPGSSRVQYKHEKTGVT